MPPKKASTGAKKASTANHPPYQDMIKEAIINLKERTGSSRQAIKKYVQANNNLSGVPDTQFTTQFNKALQKGSTTGVFDRPKGTSGPVKLSPPTKAATEKKTSTKTAKPKTATKSTTKKAPAAKKTATKSATKKAPTAKKATATKTKSKANTGKARKAPTAAPAVEEKAPVVLGKTKSGRVTKSKAASSVAKTSKPKKAPAKKAATKKATPKKA